TVVEGTGGEPTRAHVTFRLSKPASSIVTVQVQTTDGTATSGSNGRDFSPLDGAFSFGPGETEIDETVFITPDAHFEFDETFFVNILDAFGGVRVRDPQAVVTIVNDDPEPANLSGFVYEDNDNDGVKDPDEPGIAGSAIELSYQQLASGRVVLGTATTAA